MGWRRSLSRGFCLMANLFFGVERRDGTCGPQWFSFGTKSGPEAYKVKGRFIGE
jgi:hypothetical protein